MIEFPDDRALDALRAQAQAGPVLVQGALSPEACAALRAQPLAFAPFWIADRGRYHACDSIQNPELFADLQTLAEAVCDLPTRAVAGWRWTRHVQGDYALIKDDALHAPRRGPGLEVVLDFSDAASDEGETIWQRDAFSFALPHSPGALAIVDRRGPWLRHERYLGHGFGDRAILRLRLFLAI